VAGLPGSTLAGPLAVTLATALQRVADPAMGTGAHSPLLIGGAINAWVAVGVHTTRVVGTQIRISERSTLIEGMASHVLGAAANRLVPLHLAVSTDATGSHTGIDTLQLEAGLVVPTVFMGCALSIAPGVWIPLEEFWTRALDDVVGDFAMSSFTAFTVGAGVHTSVLLALSIPWAVPISKTLSTARDKRISNVVGDAGTLSTVAPHATVGVPTARRRIAILVTSEDATTNEGVASHALSTRAHRLVVTDDTFSG